MEGNSHLTDDEVLEYESDAKKSTYMSEDSSDDDDY